MKLYPTAQETYNLSDLTPGSANNLQHEWVRHQEANPGENFYIITEQGQVWTISPDAEGESLIAIPIIQKYEYGDENAIYPGPDAWNELQQDIGERFSLWPPKKEQQEHVGSLIIAVRLIELFEGNNK